jgi:hypothetical protein
VWNLGAFAPAREIILTESLIDALTFWCAGYRNVTAVYGVEGFTDEHLAVFGLYGTERVLIAYDRDDAGERAADKLAQRLMHEGIACYRIQFPHGMDVNEYALKVTPAQKSLGVVIRKAVWLGKGKAPAREPEIVYTDGKVPGLAFCLLVSQTRRGLSLSYVKKKYRPTPAAAGVVVSAATLRGQV